MLGFKEWDDSKKNASAEVPIVMKQSADYRNRAESNINEFEQKPIK